MNAEKVLVTGAAGMLGKHLCRELLSRGYHVKALCQNQAQVQAFDVPVHEITHADVLNLQAVEAEISGFDFIIHAAAVLHVWPNRSALVRDVNIKGTMNIMEAALKAGIRRMVHIGSGSSFGMGSGIAAADENSPYLGSRFNLDYLDSKYQAQKMLQEAYVKRGFPVVIINPTFMIGPDDSGPTSGKMLISICKGSMPAVSPGGRNFVFTGDVAVAAVNALKQGQAGECYIAGNENMTYKSFFSLVTEANGTKKTPLTVPSSLVLVGGAAGNFWSVVSGKAPMLSLAMSRISLLHQYVSSAKAVRELGMPQTPLKVAVEKSIDWYRKKRYL